MCSSPLLPVLMGHQEPCVLITAVILILLLCSGSHTPGAAPSFLTGTGELGLLREFSKLHCQLLLWQDFYLQLILGFCRKLTRTEVTATPSFHPRNSRDHGHKPM